ncbi:dockerin type I domain-containing protein [uncultured Psychroserpens sp.]|uniref:dockerin type I domain-containing protein n=1 Tax=uncultured Psychroserpens sp. TaxID=255436 RepID=UPI00260E7195|nr:dockerin type I domain-containing protein [uncultured Psychroserpens sp.]
MRNTIHIILLGLLGLLLLVASCKDSTSTNPKGGLDITPEEMPPIEDYEFGYGGDLNDDGNVNKEDLIIIQSAFDETIPHYPELDVNRDGKINQDDIQFMEDVLSGKRPSLIYADFIEDDIETGEPAELIIAGVNLSPETEIHFMNQTLQPSKFIEGGIEADSLYVYFEELPEISDDGTSVSLQSNGINSLQLPVYKYGMTPGNIAYSEISKNIMFQEVPEIPEEEYGVSEDSCCITRIVFKGHMKGIKIFAYNDSGEEAEGSGKKLKPKKERTLRSKAKNITILIVKNKAPFATFNFDCETIKKGIYKENFQPAGEGATQVRPQDIFEIVDFTIKDPCIPESMPFPKDVTGGAIRRDNANWGTPKPHIGSGGLAKISVPLTSITEMGCNEACWVQFVSTKITKNGESKKPLYDSKGFHVDNNTLGTDADWFCYQAQYEENGNLVFADGPHIVQNDTVWVGGKRHIFKKGDVVLRTSTFLTQLICIDPTPEKVLASFMWSVNTTYTVDPDDISVGGVTDTIIIKPVNLKQVPTKKDWAKLKAKLKKKKRDKKKCPD